MAKKTLSRGRGPRLREEELDKMVELYLEGKTFKAIAQATGRHWQTVRKYTVKSLEERPGRELRREALKEALVDHFHDLVNALASLITLVELPRVTKWEAQEWQPPVPSRRDRLLLQALRESHAKESPLWSWWDSWNQDRRDYEEALAVLQLRVRQEMKEFQNSSLGAGITLSEEIIQVLFVRGVSIAQGGPIYDPTMLNVVPQVNPDDGRGLKELWLGSSTHLAAGQDMAGLLQRVSDIMKDMGTWAEVEALQRFYRNMADTRDNIEEEVEVLSLRRAFPGRCRLCPL